MRYKLSAPVAALLCAVALLAGACSKQTEAVKDKESEASTTTTSEKATTTTTAAPTDTIADAIAADADLSRLAGLVTTAGLTEALAGPGPFTVLAPTNAAIAKIPAATLASLEQDPAGALANVLRLHVITGAVTVEDLADKDGECVDTLGGKVKVTVTGEGDDATVSFGGATVSDDDPQQASNGTIMKIDAVVTAPATDC